MSAITLYQFAISRHVNIEDLGEELVRQHGYAVNAERLERFMRNTTGDTRTKFANRIRPTEIKAAITRLHNINMQAGAVPEVRKPGLEIASIPTFVADGSGLTPLSAQEAASFAPSWAPPPAFEDTYRMALITTDEEAPVAADPREDFEALWQDPSLSLHDLAELLETDTTDVAARAAEYGLPMAKPYAPAEPVQEPDADVIAGMTDAQRTNTLYVRSSPQRRDQARQYMESRGITRDRLLVMYETQNVRDLGRIFGSQQLFYVCLGIMDIPLQRAGRPGSRSTWRKPVPVPVEPMAAAEPAAEPQRTPEDDRALGSALASFPLDSLEAEMAALERELIEVREARAPLDAEMRRIEAASAELVARDRQITTRYEQVGRALSALRYLAEH